MTWNPLAAIYDIQRTVHTLDANVRHLMSQQDEINADVAELQQAVSAIAAEIAALQAANPSLDLTALKSAVDAVAALAPPAA